MVYFSFAHLLYQFPFTGQLPYFVAVNIIKLKSTIKLSDEARINVFYQNNCDGLGCYLFTGYPLHIVCTRNPLPVIYLRVEFTGKNRKIKNRKLAVDLDTGRVYGFTGKNI